jgi:hypothetical protein
MGREPEAACLLTSPPPFQDGKMGFTALLAWALMGDTAFDAIDPINRRPV